MGSRVVDGSALWRSQKLKKVPVKYRAEYANLIPLAETNGAFECDPELIWSTVYSFNRTEITPEIVADILAEFEKADMLKRYEMDGRLYGYWIGIDKPGRLPTAVRGVQHGDLPPLPESKVTNIQGQSFSGYEYTGEVTIIDTSKEIESSGKLPPLPEGEVNKTFGKQLPVSEQLTNLLSEKWKPLDIPAAGTCTVSTDEIPINDVKRAISTLPLDSQIENSCREHFGITEPRKQWTKELKEAVRNYGHDYVLTAFKLWVESQIGFTGKKPVTTFLRSLTVTITATPAAITSPALQNVENKIAEITDSKVFFHNQQRPLLASLVKEYGQDNVLAAFREFWSDVDDTTVKFAGKNFIEQAAVRIGAYIAKKEKTEARDQAAKAALQQAQAKVESEVEEEYVEEEL